MGAVPATGEETALLEDSLVRDIAGRSFTPAGPTCSRDWDEVQEFCRNAYMPYRVRPGGRLLQPDATMLRAEVGRIIVTRFSYGVPIHLDEFDPGAGNILVLNTLRGTLRHKCDATGDAMTGRGQSFVVDCSRTDYWLDGDDRHMQLNLTIPHQCMAEIAQRWFGFVPDDRLWTRRVAFGDPDSRWQALMEYMVRSIEASGQVAGGPGMARHLEEMICLDLLQIWAERANVSLRDGARAAAPRYVREAEEIMTGEAQEPPTIGEIAQRVGVSARTLSEGFQRFRGLSPREFLRDRRLDGLNAALLAAGPGQTVTSIGADWGYVNFGAMARAYRQRFNERPSQTLALARARR